MLLDPHPRFVLVDTSHPGNVGAAARAIKVMGFGDLVLVRPRFADVLSQEETVAMASGAADVLTRARIVDDLTQALDGVHHVCATAMTPRDFGPPLAAPREHFAALALGQPIANLLPASSARAPTRMAMVFGSERYGLSNDDVYRAHVCLSIPTHPDYGSLNLAQAVQLLAYEYRQALGGYAVQARTLPPAWADAPAVQGVLEHWQAVLQQAGFLDPAAPRKLMPRLQQLLNRAALTEQEVHILRGMARSIQQAIASASTVPADVRSVEPSPAVEAVQRTNDHTTPPVSPPRTTLG